ncbi:PfkB family carbohydrate kinase [Selenomonas ruminantium]|uniref:PfkB family carbohydrate kinase n=1 Tax=Selenomonas ruminantium TaxID=971 RepID=UPI0004278557|nr:PfkB family carbohydrate kinase [Selenomonas ruminantium]
MGKVVSKADFQAVIRPALKKENKKIVLCHGVFDLVHPGHIIHLEQAKKMGDVLVVSITSAKYVRKGPGRPYFNDDMRLKFLAALECVDYVLLSEGYTVDDIVEVVEPDFYVKGSEYADESADMTGKIREERELVESHGGRLRFTGGQVFSSTKLINRGLSGLSEEVCTYMQEFKKRYGMEDILQWSEQVENLKVLVIGEIIIDKYTYCDVQGLMSKDMGYSARIESSEEYLGGAAAIARHLASFTPNVTLLSMIGNEHAIQDRLHKDLAEQMQLQIITSAEQPTIVKQRYLVRNAKREEYRKLFAVNNIAKGRKLAGESRIKLMNALKEKLPEYDVVFLCDFGHGLIDEEMAELLQEKANFLVLNCQTNSSNYGMNLITKYHHADAFSLDERELRLAYPELAENEERALRKLNEHLGTEGWLTRGSDGACCYQNGEFQSCPAFTLLVKDTVGAGDAFYAIAGIYAAVRVPKEVSLLMGNIAGALGANIVGNKDAVEKVNVLKYANTLMNV